MKENPNRLKQFLRLWPESWAVPLGLFGLYWSYYLLWIIFPFAVPYPPESIQKVVFAALTMIVFNGLVWLGIRLNFPGLFKFYTGSFSKSLKKLKTWQKVSVLLSVYFFWLFCLVLISLGL